jgi:hypothetical protein
VTVILSRLAERRERVQGIRGRAELSMSAPDWKGSGNLESAILARRPASLRLRGYAGPTTAFDVLSRPDRFWVYLPRKHAVWSGPPENLEAVTGFPALPSEIVSALLGDPFSPGDSVQLVGADRDFLTLGWEARGGRVEARFSRSSLLPAEYRWWRDGQLTAELHYADYLSESVGPWPRELSLQWPRDHASLRIRFRELTLNPEWTADAFEFRRPPGTLELEMGEDSSPDSP